MGGVAVVVPEIDAITLRLAGVVARIIPLCGRQARMSSQFLNTAQAVPCFDDLFRSRHDKQPPARV
jgi:hypothetical protein